MPKVATDSSTITKDTLPNLSAQIYENGSDKRLYFNVNDSIQNIVLNSENSSPVSIPSGIICMWSGTIATIPSGWYLCDGNNGTPDLRNRFIVCADADVSGVAKSTVTGVAAQSGDGQVIAHTHSITHTHDTARQYILAGGSGNEGIDLVGKANDSTMAAVYIPYTGSSDNYGTGTKNIAVFYSLAYIMKS